MRYIRFDKYAVYGVIRVPNLLSIVLDRSFTADGRALEEGRGRDRADLIVGMMHGSICKHGIWYGYIICSRGGSFCRR